METQQSKMVIDESIVEELLEKCFAIKDYTKRYILVHTTLDFPPPLTLWEIEGLEVTLNADFVQNSKGYTLLKWRN